MNPFAASLLVACLFMLAMTVQVFAIKISKPNAGQRTLITDSLSIDIEGNQNVPKFGYSFANDSRIQGFKVQFARASQTDSDHNEIPSTNIALASLNYDFSEFVTNSDNSVDFNITSSGGNPTFQFRIHVNSTSKSFKFDTVISGVTWNNKAAYLSLCYKVLDRDSGNGINAANSTSTRASFGKGYFDIEPRALAINGTSVKAGLRNSGNTICVEYEKWDGTLVHDPTLGYSTSVSVSFASANSFSLLVVLVALIASLW